MKPKAKPTTQATLVQLIVNFVLPIVVLTRLSNTSFGPTKALLLALAFPVVYELYNIYKNKKVSLVSVIAIAGIAITGGLSLLKLGVEWLAVRRSATYLFVAIIIVGSQLINKPVARLAIEQIFDLKKIKAILKDQKKVKQLESILKYTSYLAGTLFVLIGILSFVVTRILVTSSTNSAAYNQEYAQLRILSLPYITLPMLVGFILIIWYLIHSLEKVTGQDIEQFTKTK